MEDDDDNVFCKSIIDRYQHRPQSLANLCLAEFVANYRVQYKPTEDHINDVLPDDNEENTEKKAVKTIKLTDNYGTMTKRKGEAVIRFHRFSKDSEPSNYYRSKIMLYYPWYNEDSDLLGGFTTYEEHYNNVLPIIITNENKYNAANVENINLDDVDNPQHGWDQLAPSNEHHRGQDNEEGQEEINDMDQADIDAAAMINESDNSRNDNNNRNELSHRFEAAARKGEIPPEEYRRLMRGLNEKQKQIVMYHRQWCKNSVLALKNGSKITPYHIFLSGSGGCGKSYVIKLIQSDTIKLFKLSGLFEPDDVIVLICGTTGVASFNVNGMTIHSALSLGAKKFGEYQSLSHDKANTLRAKLGKMKL